MTLAGNVGHLNAGDGGDDPFLFADEPDAAQGEHQQSSRRAWRILIADDDEEVHSATAYALRNVEVDGARLELLHARSAIEAEGILRHELGVAVAMLDVVMETPDAGLSLVQVIRNELKLRTLRIVLRTGQPGYAPELEVLRQYDINDYRTKSELTQTRLVTTLMVAIRAYAQMELIEASNRGLTAVAHSSNSLFRVRSAREFSRALLDRLSALLGTDAHGFVCVEPNPSLDLADPGISVLHAGGRFVPWVGSALDKCADIDTQRAVKRAIAAKSCVFDGQRFVMWLGSGTRDAAAYFEIDRPLQDFELRLIEIFASNIAVGFENVDLFERLDFFAFFDPLTHLPNRTRFLADVDQDLFARQSGSRCLAIADVVRFSDINDALGHRCGDTLLIGVAKRLRSAVGPGIMIARISADTFGLFGSENAIDPASLRKAFEAPFFVHGHALVVQVRMGIVRVADSKGGAVELLRNANLAVNQARHAGGGACCWFSRNMSEDVQARVAMLHNLRAAIDFRRGLSVHYQPLLDAQNQRVIGAEALLRWRNDYGEMVSPERFIPLAERTGMINELGLWVLEEALERLSVWHKLGHDFYMAVNISPVQFRSDDFADRVKQVVDLCDVRADKLVLEIGEAIHREDQAQVHAHLSRLTGMGIRIAIDDFGSGHASLTHLAQLPVGILKIDRSFVHALTEGEVDQAVPASVVTLARMSGMQVVAEGVETQAQIETLQRLGCQFMQGYALGRPMPPEQFDAWLRERG